MDKKNKRDILLKKIKDAKTKGKHGTGKHKMPDGMMMTDAEMKKKKMDMGMM